LEFPWDPFIVYVILRLAALVRCRLVTDRRTDGYYHLCQKI